MKRTIKRNRITAPAAKTYVSIKKIKKTKEDAGQAAKAFLNRTPIWWPIPLAPRKKKAMLKDWQHRRITSAEIEQNFAKDANIGLLLGSVSGGLTDVDLDCDEAVLAAPFLLPPTKMIHGRKSSRSRHYWYVCDDCGSRVRFKGPDGTCLVELRSGAEKTCYTMIPPSIHPESGDVLEWEGALEPASVSYKVLLGAVKDIAVSSLLAKKWNSGSRHELALVLAGYLAHGGLPQERAERLVEAICHAAGDDEVEDRLQAVKTTFRGIKEGRPILGRTGLVQIIGEETLECLDKWLEVRPGANAAAPSSGKSPTAFETTDLGNARRFVSKYDQSVRFVPCWGWLYWDGKRWTKDELGVVKQYACDSVEEILHEANKIKKSEERVRLLKWYANSQSSGRLKAMVEIAEYQPGIPCAASVFDEKPWHINVENGTVDLQTGVIHSHRREDFITKIAPVEYRVDADCPRFLSFLDHIFSGNQEIIGFVQKILGYSMIGGNPEQLLFIFFGHGANGKSVLVNTIMDILGPDYAHIMNAESLMERNRGGEARNDLACLQGVRLAAAMETAASHRLNEALVKQITGGERIRARFLYREEFEFQPQFTMVLSTNHKPYIADQGHSIWRRIRLVPFDVTIPRHLQDPELKQKLLQEKEGIFNWLVQGALKYQDEGLEEPLAVKNATNSYRDEMDTLGVFLQQRTVSNPQTEVSSQVLYNAYRDWCDTMGLRYINQMVFAQRMESRGFKRSRRKTGIFWAGVGLREALEGSSADVLNELVGLN